MLLRQLKDAWCGNGFWFLVFGFHFFFNLAKRFSISTLLIKALQNRCHLTKPNLSKTQDRRPKTENPSNILTCPGTNKKGGRF